MIVGKTSCNYGWRYSKYKNPFKDLLFNSCSKWLRAIYTDMQVGRYAVTSSEDLQEKIGRSGSPMLSIGIQNGEEQLAKTSHTHWQNSIEAHFHSAGTHYYDVMVEEIPLPFGYMVGVPRVHCHQTWYTGGRWSGMYRDGYCSLLRCMEMVWSPLQDTPAHRHCRTPSNWFVCQKEMNPSRNNRRGCCGS